MKKFSAILLAVLMMLSMVAMAQTVGTAANDTATITITNAAKGHTYSVYKLFEATVTGTEDGSIAYTGAIPSALNDYFEADAAGNISVKDGVEDEVLFNALKTWAESTTATTFAVSDGSELKFVGLGYGYYVVTTTQGEAAITVTSTNPKAEIVDKNSSDPIITEDAKTVEDEEYKIGDTASFTVTFTATNYTKDNDIITKYVVKDTPTGMEINTDSIKVQVGSTDITTSVKADAATSIDKDSMTLNIAWVDQNGNSIYNSPSTVTVTYTAVVVSTTGSASNKAEISYNDKDPTESTVKVTTHQFALVKTDDTNKVLDGAKFELYDAKETDSKISLINEGSNVYRVATPAEIAADDFQSAVIEAGNVTIKGLDKDVTYYLEETEAPAGYNKLTERVEVVMSTVADVTAEVINGVYVSGGVHIKNNTGSELPSTGGMGTTLFYVVGSLMMAAAVVVLVAKKKVAAK